MIDLIFFSNVSGNTARFVEKINHSGEKIRIPIKGIFDFKPTRKYIIVTPTYGDPYGNGMVPHQVKKFLNSDNSNLLVGVISAGNINFGKEYGLAGDLISRKYGVPLLYKFELAGNSSDVQKVEKILKTIDKTEEQ